MIGKPLVIITPASPDRRCSDLILAYRLPDDMVVSTIRIDDRAFNITRPLDVWPEITARSDAGMLIIVFPGVKASEFQARYPQGLPRVSIEASTLLPMPDDPIIWPVF